MTRQLFALIAGAALAAGATASAHHSQVAVYQTSAEQKIEGKLVQILIRSPHSWVHIEGKDIKDPGAAVQRFAIEWGGAAQLSRQGVDGKTLKVGDVMKITGRPGRNPADKRLLMMYMERPADGWSWGNRPGEVVD